MPKYAITHPGRAHRDEALALGLAIATGLLSINAPVYRREPIDEELDDPEILVFDVGGRHEPGRLNFDHHQMPRGTRECALSLLARHMGVEEILADRPWYQATVIIDSQGPGIMARELGLDKLPPALVSPFEMAILDDLSRVEEEICLGLKELVSRTMEKRLADARALRDRGLWLDDNHRLMDVGGVRALVVEDDDPRGLGELRERLGGDVALSLNHDDRGEGWSIYRYDDDPRVDLSRLDGDPLVHFAHKSGFIAKTRTLIPVESVLSLVKRALV